MNCGGFGDCVACLRGNCMWAEMVNGSSECGFDIAEFSKKVLAIIDDQIGCPKPSLDSSGGFYAIMGIGASGLGLILLAAFCWWKFRNRGLSGFRQIKPCDEEQEMVVVSSLEEVGDAPAQLQDLPQQSPLSPVMVMELRSGTLKPRVSGAGKKKLSKERQD